MMLAGRRRRRLRVLLAVMVIPAVLGLSSCGNSITLLPSAAPGTYAIPIAATGTTSGLVHSSQLTLTVTP
jgi:hypothetical protein